MGVSEALIALAGALRGATRRRVFSLGRRAPDAPALLMVELDNEDEAGAVFEALTGKPYRRGDWRRW